MSLDGVGCDRGAVFYFRHHLLFSLWSHGNWISQFLYINRFYLLLD